MGSDIAAREDVFKVLRKVSVNRHQILEAAMLGALFDHPNFAVLLDDGGFDLADFFIEQHFVRQMAVENLLTDFGHALRAKRVGRARPAEWRLRLLVGLKQRLVRPLGRRRGIRLDPVQAIKYCPNTFGSHRDCFLYVLNWLVHECFCPFHCLGISSLVVGCWSLARTFQSGSVNEQRTTTWDERTTLLQIQISEAFILLTRLCIYTALTMSGRKSGLNGQIKVPGG